MMTDAQKFGHSTARRSVLPLTKEDITEGIGLVDQDDNISMDNSIQSTSLTSYAARQHRKSKSRRIHENFNSKFRIPRYFKRLFNIKSLDFETSVWDMINLILRPKQVYRSLYYQKETRNKWSRDDPSFVILLCGLLSVSAVGWSLVYARSFGKCIRLIFHMVVVDFLLAGFIIATFGWIISSKLLLDKNIKDGSSFSTDGFLRRIIPFNSPVEWAYCFDVHCNAYLLIWVLLYLIELVLLPVLRLDNYIATLLGNTLYFIALAYYFIISFYGYNTLPFLHKTEYILLFIPVLAFIWLILSLSNINLAAYMLKYYFS